MLIDDVRELIGNTPLLRLSRLADAVGLSECWNLWLKLESQNPGRSVKDRAGMALLSWLKENHPEALGLESTSGNTGIGLAVASLGDKDRPIAYVDSVIPQAKVNHLRMLGLKVHFIELCEEEQRLQQGVSKRVEAILKCCKKNPRFVWVNQYGNPAYPLWHARTTAPEIFTELSSVRSVFASIGTGGTISGLGYYVHSCGLQCTVVGVEPEGSTISGGSAGPYYQHGSGNSFVPDNYWREYVDICVKVSDRDACEMMTLTARSEGLLVGDSTGAAIFAAVAFAKQHPFPSCEDDNLVVIVSDCGINYLADPISRKIDYSDELSPR